MKFLSSVFLSLFLAGGAGAQVSLDQLDAAMDARDDAMAAFRERLNDPDPDRAMAAMTLLISDGDDQQRAMAIEHGLTSTDPAIQLAAVRAILESRPILISRWSTKGEKASNRWNGRVADFDGSVDGDGVARVPLPVGSQSEDQNCFLIEGEPDNIYSCLFRINGGELSAKLHGSWSQFALDQSGRLVGEQQIDGIRTDVVVSLGM